MATPSPDESFLDFVPDALCDFYQALLERGFSKPQAFALTQRYFDRTLQAIHSDVARCQAGCDDPLDEYTFERPPSNGDDEDDDLPYIEDYGDDD